MEKVTLIFDDETFQVSLLTLRQNCDAPALFGVASYHVSSSAPAPIVRSFVEALNGTDIKITNKNGVYFSSLCSEFGFWVLPAKISDFCTSPEPQIWLFESSISEQAGKNAELEAAINQLTGHLGDFGTLIERSHLGMSLGKMGGMALPKYALSTWGCLR
jgi:hypothetical protein